MLSGLKIRCFDKVIGVSNQGSDLTFVTGHVRLDESLDLRDYTT